MKKFICVFLMIFTVSLIFAEGAMEDSEAPAFPDHVPFAREYRQAYDYMVTGITEDFAMMILKMDGIEDEEAGKQEFREGYDQFVKKYEENDARMTELCERMVSGKYMDSEECEQYMSDLRNCNMMLMLTYAMMYSMMDGLDFEMSD